MHESDEAGASEHQAIQEYDTGFVGWREQPTAARFMTASENFRYGAHAATAWPDVPECYQHCICDNTDAEYDVQPACSCTECRQLILDNCQEWLHGGTASVWWPAAEFSERFKRIALAVQPPVGAAWPECSKAPILCRDAAAHCGAV